MRAGTMNSAAPRRFSCVEGESVGVIDRVEIVTGVGSILHDADGDGADLERLACFGGDEADVDLWDR